MSAVEPRDPIQTRIEEMIAKDRVPLAPFPVTVRRLDEVLARKHYNQGDLISVIRTDEVLVASVLRYANSSAVRSGHEIASLAEAVARTGVQELRSLALSASLGASLKKEGALQELRHEVWRSGMFSAELARRLAVHRNLSSDQAFLGGLLWSFGRIVAISCIEHLIGQTPNIAPRSMDAWFRLVERFDGSIMALICERWELPTLVREVLRARDQDATRNAAVGPIVSLLAATQAIAILADKAVSVSADALRAVKGLEPTEIPWIVEQLPSIPALVWSMGPAETGTTTTPSAVLSAPRPSSEIVAVRIPVTQRRASGDVVSTCIALTEHGFLLEGEAMLQKNYVARFELQTLEGPFDLFGNVVHVEHHASGSRAEIKPLALSGPLKARWEALVAAARKGAQAEAPTSLVPIPVAAFTNPGPSPVRSYPEPARGTRFDSAPLQRMGSLGSTVSVSPTTVRLIYLAAAAVIAVLLLRMGFEIFVR